MAIAEKIKEWMEKSSWIRKMFEEGSALKAAMVWRMCLTLLWVIPIWNHQHFLRKSLTESRGADGRQTWLYAKCRISGNQKVGGRLPVPGE